MRSKTKLSARRGTGPKTVGRPVLQDLLEHPHVGVKLFGASLGTVELVRRRFALHHVVVELVRHDDGLAGKRISRKLEDDVLAQSQTGAKRMPSRLSSSREKATRQA